MFTLLLYVLTCFIIGIVEATNNITANDWTVLKSFFLVANCKTEFCNALSNNQTCLLPVVCDTAGNVLQLQLNNYNLSGSLIPEIAQLKQLQSLVLSNNGFDSTIPSELAQLSQLTLLDLSNNRFTGTVSEEFGRSSVKMLALHSNRLTGVAPFFPRATSCSLQTSTAGNDLCCAKGQNQPCCAASSCFCSVQPPCREFAPAPSRCVLDNADGPDHALCMTSSTLDDRAAPVDYTIQLIDNFTISFWAKAREPLNFPQSATTAGIIYIPRGMLFYPEPLPGVTRTFGFHLGTDGFSIVWHGGAMIASIVVQRIPLIGWHHYSLVYSNGEQFVYLDGNTRDLVQSFKAIDRTQRVGAGLTFARTRVLWTGAYGDWGTGFEGWISELRLANRSIHGGEALQQINNQSAWDFSFSMQGCSGENHVGTEIDRFKLQQAWLVCKESLPTCGSKTPEFQAGESAGCLCEIAGGEQQCFGGEWLSNDTNTVISGPIANWKFDNEGAAVLDSSGNGNHGRWMGARGIVMTNLTDTGPTKYTKFIGGGYVDFGNAAAFNYGTRDFTVEMSLRLTFIDSQILLWKGNACESNNNFATIWISGDTEWWGYLCESASTVNRVLTKAPITAKDNQWHRLRWTRRGVTNEISLDGAVIGTENGLGVTNIDNPMPLLFGARNCPALGGVINYLVSDVANVVIRVDKPLCSRNVNTGNFTASMDLQSRGCRQVIGLCSPTKQGRQCCAAPNCAECNEYRTCNRYFTTMQTTATTTTTATLVTMRNATTLSTTLVMNTSQTSEIGTTLSTNIATTTSTNVSETNVSETIPLTTTTTTSTNISTSISSTITTAVANDTVRETVVATVAEPLPAWIFGAAGGGVAALLLLIGVISLTCWCNKRAAIQPHSTQQMMMSSNDTKMDSFRETSSIEQRSNQYAALSSVPSNEYGAAPHVASNYSSASSVALPNAMQHYDNFANVQGVSQTSHYDDVPIRVPSAQYEPAPTKITIE